MRNIKKILAFVLVLMMAFSTCLVTGVAADENTTIYFEVPADWDSYASIFCHIWPYGGDPLANWQSKKEKCTAVADSEGLFSYDIDKKVGGLVEDTTYCVIFSADTGEQTYDAIMTTACYGDTLYVDPEVVYENPADSSKTCAGAFWRNQDPAVFGPLKQISSIGTVVGTAFPEGITKLDTFYIFLQTNLENARTYSLKDDQTIIDDIKAGLELTDEEVDFILTESGVTITWNGKDYVGATASGDEMNIILGDANLDEDVNIKDATLIQKFAAELVTLTDQEFESADVNADLSVNVKDATAIQKYAAEIETDYPIGETFVYLPL